MGGLERRQQPERYAKLGLKMVKMSKKVTQNCT
jgi:hypothetical protein